MKNLGVASIDVTGKGLASAAEFWDSEPMIGGGALTSIPPDLAE